MLKHCYQGQKPQNRWKNNNNIIKKSLKQHPNITKQDDTYIA